MWLGGRPLCLLELRLEGYVKRAQRRSGDGVAQLVARFNHLGLAAPQHQQGGGPPKQYGTPE